MTKEEAIEVIKDEIDYLESDVAEYPEPELLEALKVVLEILNE